MARADCDVWRGFELMGRYIDRNLREAKKRAALARNSGQAREDLTTWRDRRRRLSMVQGAMCATGDLAELKRPLDGAPSEADDVRAVRMLATAMLTHFINEEVRKRFDSVGFSRRTTRALMDGGLCAPEPLLSMNMKAIKACPGLGKAKLTEIEKYRGRQFGS